MMPWWVVWLLCSASFLFGAWWASREKALDALRADIKMTLLDIDNEVKLDPTDPDFSAGRAMGLRQAQHMFEAVLERDTRRGKYGD